MGTKYQFRPGVQVGQRQVLRPLHGGSVVAWRSPQDIERWISQAPEGVDALHLRRVLAGIRELGYGVWKLEPSSTSILSEIGDIADALRQNPNLVKLRWELWRLLGLFAGHGYTPDELDAGGHFPVGYIIAPVFDADDEIRYTLDLHVLRAGMTADEVRSCARRLLSGATLLTRHLGGQPRKLPASH